MTTIATLMALAGILFLGLVWAMALRSLGRICVALVRRASGPRRDSAPA